MTTRRFIILQDGTFAEGTNFDTQKASLVSDRNLTVKSSGGDSTTIQGAIDIFDDSMLGDDAKISVDAGTYNESLDVSSIYGKLVIEGDTRGLASLSYNHNQQIVSDNTNSGTGTCTLARSGASNEIITVTGSLGNPDFDANGWGNGDNVLITANGTYSTATISSVSNNVITFSAGVADAGVDGGTITLVPDRKITNSSGVFLSSTNKEAKIVLKGFSITSTATISSNGILEISERSTVQIENVLIRDSGTSLANISAISGSVILSGKENSLIEGSIGIRLRRRSRLEGGYVSCQYQSSHGINSRTGSIVNSQNSNFITDGSAAILAGSGTFLKADSSNILTTSSTANGITVLGSRITVDSSIIKAKTKGTGDGINIRDYANVEGNDIEVDNFDNGVIVRRGSEAFLDGSTVTNCTTGIQAIRNSYVKALNTLAKMSGNTSNYNPATSDTLGNIDSIITLS